MNQVKVSGLVTKPPKHGGEGDRAYTFLSVRTAEERSCILDVAAFGDAARAAADLESGDEITLSGRIGIKKDKQLTETAKRDVWMLHVVAERIEKAGGREPGADDGEVDF